MTSTRRPSRTSTLSLKIRMSKIRNSGNRWDSRRILLIHFLLFRHSALAEVGDVLQRLTFSSTIFRSLLLSGLLTCPPENFDYNGRMILTSSPAMTNQQLQTINSVYE